MAAWLTHARLAAFQLGKGYTVHMGVEPVVVGRKARVESLSEDGNKRLLK